jgi:chemotaxis protein MotB
MFDFNFTHPDREKKIAEQKGFKYLRHVPDDKGHDPAREIGSSNWIFSYADMMTSMTVFLILLLSFSQISYEKMTQVSQSAQEVTASDKVQGAIPKIKTPIQQAEEQLKDLPAMEGIEFIKEGSGASIVIDDAILYQSGRAAISDEAKKNLIPIFDLLKKLPPDYYFVIEGHTDDNPIRTAQYWSNWELSAARALSVLLVMKEMGFDERHLSFHGFGEQRPLQPNRDPKGKPIVENQAQNRRAVIRIRQKLDVTTEP